MGIESQPRNSLYSHSGFINATCKFQEGSKDIWLSYR